MGLEQKSAWASLIGTSAFGGLIWVLSQLGIGFSRQAVELTGIVCAGGLVISGAFWLHIAWVWLRRRGLQLGPAIGIAIGLAILMPSILWGFWTWIPIEQINKPNISFQKYALFWVELEPDVYQLRAVLVLVNADSVPHFISAVNFDNISIGSIARGSMYVQRIVQTGKAVEIDGDNYIEAGKPGYFPVELPVKLFAHHNGGAFPLIYTFGTWTLQMGDQKVEISPRRTCTYEHSVNEKQWGALLKSDTEIKIDDLDFQRMPSLPGKGPEINYMVFNRDKSARIDDPWFSQTPSVKTEDGVMLFIRGRGEPPLEEGWIVLGHTYNEVWSDPRKLELYNSIFPHGEDGKPRPFGVFAGAEKEMMGD